MYLVRACIAFGLFALVCALGFTPVLSLTFTQSRAGESENPILEAPMLTALNGTPLAATGPLAGNLLKVFHYGPPTYWALETIWHLAQTDIFVGCVSR